MKLSKIEQQLIKQHQNKKNYIHLKENILEKIRNRVDELQLNRKRFAERVGRNHSHISTVLRGARPVTIELLVEMCVALDLDLQVTVNEKTEIFEEVI